ncbi:MAG: hypothetical protein KBT27_03510 [Prevotellaceae bacterium]|nr:hypothetical protein [Candidatus Faecinaster equi]
MTKFKGRVGYSVTEEIRPGVFAQECIKESTYYGDVEDPYIRHTSKEGINDDLAISHTISILVDPKSVDRAPNMRYVTYMGTRWNITGVQYKYPRLILTLGGVYNGPIPEYDSIG